VREQLCFINGMESVFAFKLNCNCAIDHQIRAKTTVQLNALVDDRYRLLTFNPSTQLLQFISEARFIS